MRGSDTGVRLELSTELAILSMVETCKADSEWLAPPRVGMYPAELQCVEKDWYERFVHGYWSNDHW